MPISPTPPRGAKTSSSEGRGMAGVRSAGGFGDGRREEHVGRRDGGDTAIGQTQPEPARFVERLELATELAVSQLHAHNFANTSGAREPVSADAGKALPGLPLRQTNRHL